MRKRKREKSVVKNIAVNDSVITLNNIINSLFNKVDVKTNDNSINNPTISG